MGCQLRSLFFFLYVISRYVINYGRKRIAHRYLAPSAVQAGNAVVALDRLPALGAFSVAITLDPVVNHRLGCLFALDVGRYAGGWRSLHAPLVHRILAN